VLDVHFVSGLATACQTGKTQPGVVGDGAIQVGEMVSLADSFLQSPLLRRVLGASTETVEKLDRRLQSSSVWVACVMGVLALQVALIFTHRPWLDEFQAIQLAVQAPDVPSLLAWLRYEGHPPLWYLILRGLAHIVNPLDALPITALLLALPMQVAILFASPFSRMERLLIATSEFVLFEFLTLSRSLTLGATVFVVVIACWRRRWTWLGIAVLPFCDFLFGVLSGICVLLKFREKNVWWPGIALWLASGLVSGWMVLPAPDELSAFITIGLAHDALGWLSNIGTLALPFQGGIIPFWNVPPFPVAGLLAPAFLWFAWLQTKGDHFHRAMLFGFLGFTLLFSVAFYPFAIRHLMLAALLLIALAWLRLDRGEHPSAGFRLWILLAALCGLATAAINLVKPFDTASVAAREIERRGLAGKHWMVFPDSRAQGVSALTGIEFERTERGCMESFIRWNYRSSLQSADEMNAFLRRKVSAYGRFYLLSDVDLSLLLAPGLLQRIAYVPAGYDGQEFYLFVVGPNAAERPVSLPRCVPDQRPFARL